jgi:hypothetical protein
MGNLSIGRPYWLLGDLNECTCLAPAHIQSNQPALNQNSFFCFPYPIIAQILNFINNLLRIYHFFHPLYKQFLDNVLMYHPSSKVFSINKMVKQKRKDYINKRHLKLTSHS